jgi:hypothetical protein
MDAISQFEQVVDYIYGVYLDAITGFERLRQWFEQHQGVALELLKSSHPELASTEYLDSVEMAYGNGPPADPKSIVLHRCTQRQYKERNMEGGLNYKFLGNMALVALYQYWEDFHRANIAVMLGKDKNDLRAPIMGDLRLLRISIIHHAGIALKEVERCELLKWFREGDAISLDKDQFEEIIFHVKFMISAFRHAPREASQSR